MIHGKKAINEFAILKANGLSLRQAGHKGEALEHYSWDRAKFNALSRLVKAWHLSETFEPTTDMPGNLLSMTQFVVTTACACHDASKANQWSMFFEYSDKDLLRDIFIAAESLRNSINLIRDYLDAWISLRLDFAEPLSCWEVDHLTCLWVSLGLDSELVELLAEVLQLRFVDGRLLVSLANAQSDDVVDTVKSAFLAALTFRRFSESRWASIGTSMQGIAAGLLLGLDDLVEYIIADPSSSKYFLNGWKRLVGDRRSFVVVQALVTRVSESFILELMHDARILRRLGELQSIIQEELAWLCDLPLEVYDFLAGLCASSGTALRSTCIRAGHVIAAFLEFRVFERTKEHPFSLVVGGPASWQQTLSDLSSGPEPQEQVAWQMWSLLRAGYPSHRLVKVLKGHSRP